MVHVHHGDLTYYVGQAIVKNIHDHWFKLSVVHDMPKRTIQVFYNGELVHTAKDNGGDAHNFKAGVYLTDDANYKMEVMIKNIKIYEQ